MKKNLCIIFLLLAAVYLVPLGVRDFFSPDETRYAEIAREMLVRNNWVTPYLNGVTYFEKPVLSYWLFAAAQKFLGENNFTVRLPCALAALLSALLIYLFSRRFSEGGKTEAAVSTIIFLQIPLVFCLCTAATTDPPLLLFLTAGMTTFYCAVHAEKKMQTVLWLFLFGLSAGAGFLTKGFLAFALPGIAIAAYLIWTRKFRELFLYPWLPLLAALLVALPWALMIHREQPEFWNYFIYDEHIKRFMAKEQHPQPFWFFIPVFLGGFGFFLLYLPQAVRGLKTNCIKNDFYLYNLCWIVFPFLFLSASSGKLATYILPCFAPASILFGAGIRRDMLEDGHALWYDRVSKLFAVLLLIAAAGLAAIQIWDPFWAPFSKEECGKWIAILTAGLTAAVLLFCSASKKDIRKKLLLFCMVPLIVYALFPFIIPDLFMLNKSACRLLETIKPKLPENAIILSFRYPFQDVCWVLKRDDILMYQAGGELTKGLKFMKRKDRILSIAQTNELIKKERTREIVLFLPDYIYHEEKNRIPLPKRIEKLRNPNSKFIALIF